MTAKPWKRSKSVSFTASNSSEAAYTGRFAPSPTGPLHLGSLTTAVASYLEAKVHGGRWLLRIDDIDAPRSQPGASDAIRFALEAHHLQWDGPTLWQSKQTPAYEAAAARLLAAKESFYCRCSRSQLDAAAPYPGTCRSQTHFRDDAAVRVRANDRVITFDDALQGPVQTDLGKTCGDFVIWRRDGLPAYQLATAVDDGAAAITHVVRGHDLLDVTARQLHLINLLDLQAPRYAHLPVVVDAASIKLSKRTGAKPLDNTQALGNLQAALHLLGLADCTRAPVGSPAELLDWAIGAWRMLDLSNQQTLEQQ